MLNRYELFFLEFSVLHFKFVLDLFGRHIWNGEFHSRRFTRSVYVGVMEGAGTSLELAAIVGSMMGFSLICRQYGLPITSPSIPLPELVLTVCCRWRL